MVSGRIEVRDTSFPQRRGIHGRVVGGNRDGGKALVVTAEILEAFRRWLLEEERTSEKTVRKYFYYLPKLVGFAFRSKEDVSRAFEIMKLTKTSREALSRLFTFVERKLDGYEDLVARLRKAMPKAIKSREDTYVPSDEEVEKLGRCLSGKGTVYRLHFLVIAYSGCRGEEAHYILTHARGLRWVELGNYVRIHLPPELQRGSKNEFVVYMPRALWVQVLGYEGVMYHEDTFEKRYRECGLGLKYLRKWWRQKAKVLGVDSETIEAFQGRVSTIGGRHYTDWIPILDREYPRIARELSRAIEVFL